MGLFINYFNPINCFTIYTSFLGDNRTYQLENDGFELANTERQRELNIELYVFRFVEQR